MYDTWPLFKLILVLSVLNPNITLAPSEKQGCEPVIAIIIVTNPQII